MQMHIIKIFQTFFKKSRKNRGVKVLLIVYWVSGNNIFRHCSVATLRFRVGKGDCVLTRSTVAKLETTNTAHPHLLLQAEFAVYLRTVPGWLMLLCRRVQNRMT